MRDSRSYRIVRLAVLLLLAAFTLYPLWALGVASLETPFAAAAVFRWIPKVASLHPYVEMWKTEPLLRCLLNSLLVSSASAVVSLPIAILAAYAVTRYRLAGSGVFLRVVLATQVFPGVLFLLPLFVIYSTIQTDTGIPLDDTYVGLIFTYLTFALPFSIWMLTGYFATIPRDVEEAAMVDGAGRLHAFFHTTIRMAAPGVAAIGVFTSMTAWGEVLFGSVMTNSATRTLPVGLQLFESSITPGSVIDWNQLMAASLTVSIPVVIGFLALQRHFVRGLSAGAVR